MKYNPQLEKIRLLETELAAADPDRAAKLTREIVRLKAAAFHRDDDARRFALSRRTRRIFRSFSPPRRRFPVRARFVPFETGSNETVSKEKT